MRIPRLDPLLGKHIRQRCRLCRGLATLSCRAIVDWYPRQQVNARSASRELDEPRGRHYRGARERHTGLDASSDGLLVISRADPRFDCVHLGRPSLRTRRVARALRHPLRFGNHILFQSMTALFASGRIIDLILLLVLMETGALVLFRLATGRGPRIGRLLPTLISGGLLLVALRAALVDARWESVALPLLGALIAHLVDLYARWR